MLNLFSIALAVVRIYILYMSAITVSRLISVKSFVGLSRRYRFGYAIALLLAFKLARYSHLMLTDINGIYSTNVGSACVNNVLCKARLTIMKMKAFSQLFIVKALEIGEAMYTRYYTFSSREKGYRCTDLH